MNAEKPIFIVGTGRSGTHFLTSVILTNNEITDLMVGKENPEVFFKVSNSAINEINVNIEKTYSLLIENAYPKRFLDQSHPNLWRSHNILDKFPEAKFLCVVRNPFSVAYSTMKHKGVRSRLEGVKFREYPSPSCFFGIEGSFINKYPSLDVYERCTLRWCAHMREIDRLVTVTPKSFLPVYYEELLLNTDIELSKISTFLGMNSTFRIENPKVESIYKKSNLTENQKYNMTNIIKNYFSEFPLKTPSLIPLQSYIS